MGFRVSGFGFRVWGLGFRASGFGSRDFGLFWVSPPKDRATRKGSEGACMEWAGLYVVGKEGVTPSPHAMLTLDPEILDQGCSKGPSEEGTIGNTHR